MTDPRLRAWATVLVDYSTRVQPGQTVVITGQTPAEPLLRAVYEVVVERGAFPVVVPVLPGLQTTMLAKGNDAQLQFISPVDRFAREEADILINILAEPNTRSLATADPARQVMLQKARASLLEATMRRDAEGSLRWVLTMYPTDGYAQDADLSTAEFTDFILNACKLNTPDPAAAWRAQSDEQARLIDWLAGKSEVRIVGQDTDLRVNVAGRTWVNANGSHNFPDGEIFTGPVEDGVEGHVRFSFPVVTHGREIQDIRLKFEAGKVVDASAARNEEFLIETLDTDPGARRLGEFAIGTNFDIQRFSRNILFDEKIGGTVHMAVGAGYPSTGSTNTSAVHWDMICDLRDGGAVLVDGESFMRDGRFLV